MKGSILTAPTQWSPSHRPTLFIAGGISGCPDWQTGVCERIAGAVEVDVINPRREGWDMKAHDEESMKQIRWEHWHLQRSDSILFWFPRETLCPITLLELGKYLARTEVDLTVGTHPEYQRRLDVVVQCGLERPLMTIWSDLDVMVDQWLAGSGGG